MSTIKLYDVDVSESKRARAPNILLTTGLYCCIGVGIYAPRKGVGQLCHHPHAKNAYNFLERNTQKDKEYNAFLAGGHTYADLPPNKAKETRSWIEKIRELARERCTNVADKLDTYEASSIELNLGEPNTATIYGYINSNDFKDNMPFAVWIYDLATSDLRTLLRPAD